MEIFFNQAITSYECKDEPALSGEELLELGENLLEQPRYKDDFREDFQQELK